MPVLAAHAAFLGVLLGAFVSLPGLASMARALRRRDALVLAALTALAWALRAFVAPRTIMRGHYNGYEHVALMFDVARGEGRPTETFLPGHGALLAWIDAFAGLSLDRCFTVDIVVGALAAPVAFFALWRWGHPAALALVGAAIVALDPVHARFSASEDPMPLVALCAWLALLGVALARRDGLREGTWLAATALAFALTTKADTLALWPGFVALWWAAPTPDDGAPTPAWSPRTLAPFAWPAALAALLVLSAARSSTYMTNPRYGGMGALTYLQHAAEFPFGVVLHNPLADPRYAAPGVTALAAVGMLVGLRRRDRTAVACVVFLWALFVRIYLDFPLPFGDPRRVSGPRLVFGLWYPTRLTTGVKGDARWNLHAMVPWTPAAVAGAAWVLSRVRTRGRAALVALCLLGLASFATTRAWWRHRWADQREADLVMRAARTLALRLPCALVLPQNSDDQGPIARHERPLSLLDAVDARWQSVPRVREAAPSQARCAVYVRGLSCYVWRHDATPERTQAEHAQCRERFDDAPIAPMPGLVERFVYEDYSSFPVVAETVTIGFYRAPP